MSSLKTLLVSALLATVAVATSHESNGGGGGGKPAGGGWSEGGNNKSPPQTASPVFGAAPSCPAGCIPIPAGGMPPPPQQTQPGQLIVQVVSVADANGSLKYFPNKVDAPAGSIVQFQFHPKNHTITESSFAEPCKPLAANLTSSTRPGVRSGFIPVKGDEPFTPVYNVLVNDTKPIWIFCGQTTHCQKGMAMVINQPKEGPNTIEKYIENAAKVPLPPAAAAPPAAPPAATVSAPPAATVSAPPAAPPPARSSAASSVAFGGGAPPAQTAQTAASTAATVAPAVTASGAAPATFTGAASHLNVRDASSFAGVVIGAMVALL